MPTGISKPALVFFVHGAFGSGAAFESEAQGGMISFVAGCSYSDVFVAVAPVSGHSNTTCTLKRPVPLFMTFGTKDIGATSTFIADLNIWSKLDVCPSTPTLTHPYPASNAKSGVTRASYGPCSQGSSLVLDSILGEGHQWPDSKRLNQSDEVWAFFKQYSLNRTTGVHPEKALAPRETFTVAYSEGLVKLSGVGEKSRVRVVDSQGRVMETPTLTHGQFGFTGKPSGLYFITVTDGHESSEQKLIIP